MVQLLEAAHHRLSAGDTDVAARATEVPALELRDAGTHAIFKLAELFSASRATVYRTLEGAIHSTKPSRSDT